MTYFDRIVCDYPLPDPHDQDRAFFTRGFGGFGTERYAITRDGRLIRRERVEYAVRFTQGRVEWTLATMGLRRVAALVGRDSWMSAPEDEG